MSKLIYITEAQLNEIVGNGAYLNQQDTTNEYRFGGSEVSSDGVTGDYVDGNVELGNPIITDKFAKQLTKPRVRGMGRTVLPESNQDMTGKQNTFQISDDTINSIRQSLSNYNGSGNDAGVKRGQKIINDKRISNDDGYRILDDFATGKAGAMLDPEGKLQKEIRRKLDTAENMSRNNREAKMERGENILKSAPKTGMKGGAHTPKGNNTIGVTYEN